MNNMKLLIGSVVVAILLVGVAIFVALDKPEVPEPKVGAVPSTTLTQSALEVGGVGLHYAKESIRVATTTACILVGPSATSSKMVFVDLNFAVATNTGDGLKWVFYKTPGNNDFATSVANWLGEIPVDYKKKTITFTPSQYPGASSTPDGIGSTLFNFGTSSNVLVELENGSGAQQALSIGSSGSCTAEWRTAFLNQ